LTKEINASKYISTIHLYHAIGIYARFRGRNRMGEGDHSGRIAVFCRLQRKGSVLLIRRAVLPHLGLVTIPGGRKEAMETPQAACIREMREETGLEVFSPLLAGVVSFFSPASGRETLCFYFSARSFSGRPRSSPEGEIFWIPVLESYQLEDVSPLYRLIGPFLVGRRGCFLVGRVDLGPEGQIESHDLRWQ
jgi:8-oxo-dGTP diphosphatase